jgi:peptidoglycan/LPS O-acetylase OafA/YrhL
MVLAMTQIANRPAALTLAALAATLIIIAGGKTPGLSWAPLAHIGQISYGLYLWHYPVVVVGMDILPRSIPLWARMLLVTALSITTAEASHRWIEQPFLRLKGRLARRSTLVTLPNGGLSRP